ncbi:hypothetical protein [Hymenobacter crusticola]|uniref:Uncharacterized protein n=1 Tax=Hymenobacter crusticola TaxID=1770526 RepID=A0A243WJ11_9BACT|nr:hypothetical protein [Hymenobacter crusticola]OUJ75894.1 hypothetical protein BXP70_00950 [Hymenobacter crusticola]
MRVIRLLILLIFLTLASRAGWAQARPKTPPTPEAESVQVRVALPTVVGVASEYVGALFSKDKRQNLFKQKRSRTSNPVLILDVPNAPGRWLERNFGRDTP